MRSRLRFLTVLIGLGTVLVASAATAADLGKPGWTPRQTVPEQSYYEPARAPIFQGLYWGASLGYGWGESEQNYDRNDNHGLASTEPEGALGSLTLGYNMRIAPQFLIGVEGDLGIMDVSADDKIVYDGHVYKTEFGPLWGTLRGRAGFVWERALLYGTAGLAFMDVDEVSIGNTPGETARNEDFRTGWVVGGGVEYALMPSITGKIEYLHMDFGSYEGLSANGESFSFENRVDVIRTGLNFTF